MSEPTISFVIPHKGRENLLQETINSISLQDYDLSLIEVIVVTQNEKLSDNTLVFDRQLPLSVFARPVTETISALRNYGAEHASGEYLAFLDADVYISKNWTKRMLDELHADENRVIVSGIQENSRNANSLEKIRTALNNMNMDCYVDSLHGANLFLRFATFRATDGFPVELRTCEDVHFTSAASRMGSLYITSGATFIHLGEDRDYPVMFKKEIWRGLSNLHSYRGRRVPMREIPSLAIPVILMPIFLLGIVLSLLGLYTPSLVAILLVATPVVLYSIRLYKNPAGHNIKFTDLLAFYTVYFAARSIGSYKGLMNSLIKRQV